MSAPNPVYPRVLHIIHNPRFPQQGGGRMNQVFGWNDPDQLAQGYIDDIAFCSYGYANYQIVERIEVDAFPVKADGFRYTLESFLRCWRQRHTCHHPDAVDYQRILADFEILRRVDDDEIDEIWLSAFPYAGYYESRMGGPGAFWCNAPPLEDTGHASKRFVIMGFNFERGVGEMLENLGHRAESILEPVFRRSRPGTNLWEHFTRYDLSHPRRAEVGTVHFAPNSEQDYDWGNKRKVWSRCDSWYDFPDLEAAPRLVDCREWGAGDTRLHHVWWLRHFPHLAGESGGISHNWWEYVVAPPDPRGF